MARIKYSHEKLVARPGVEPGFQGYEPSVLPVTLPRGLPVFPGCQIILIVRLKSRPACCISILSMQSAVIPDHRKFPYFQNDRVDPLFVLGCRKGWNRTSDPHIISVIL